MAEEANPENKSLRIMIPPDGKPTFSNSIQISVSDDAVTLQFLYVRPNTTDAVLVGETVLTPQHAIRFQKTLDATIKKHFTRHLGE
jgi:hypothetical protein